MTNMKQVLRSVSTPILGYALIVIGALIFQDLSFGRLTHESPAHALIIGGGLTALTCVLAGYLVARISPSHAVWHAAPLVVWLCIETTLIHLRGLSPLWFDVMAGGSNALGVAIGVAIWLRLNPMTKEESS